MIWYGSRTLTPPPFQLFERKVNYMDKTQDKINKRELEWVWC